MKQTAPNKPTEKKSAPIASENQSSPTKTSQDVPLDIPVTGGFRLIWRSNTSVQKSSLMSVPGLPPKTWLDSLADHAVWILAIGVLSVCLWATLLY